MENELMLDEKNIMVMKLLHYFITEKNYNPIVLQGVDNEIWLENLDEDCKVIRIVSEYIHNDEQYAFDVFKTKRIMSKIKKKTFSFSVNTLNILLDVNEDLTIEGTKNITPVSLPGTDLNITLTSMLKRVDVAVQDLATKTMEGNFPGGETIQYGIEDGAVGLATTGNHLSEETLAVVNEWTEKIKAGEVNIPTTREELKAMNF